MNKSSAALRLLTISGLIAALYVALTFTVPWLSFGMMQLRLSEVLTVLPLFYPPSVVGLSVGCVVSNLIGFLTGANPIGLIDAPVGGMATLLAALCTCYIGQKIQHRHGRLLLGLLPPVLFNAIIVGAELTVLFLDLFWVNFFWVFAGQFLVCYLLGYPLGLALSKNDLYRRIFKL